MQDAEKRKLGDIVKKNDEGKEEILYIIGFCCGVIFQRIVVCPKVKMNFSHMGDQGLIACSQKRVLRPVDGKDCSKIVNNTQPKRTGGTKNSRTTLRLVVCLFAESLRAVNSCVNNN